MVGLRPSNIVHKKVRAANSLLHHTWGGVRQNSVVQPIPQLKYIPETVAHGDTTDVFPVLKVELKIRVTPP